MVMCIDGASYNAVAGAQASATKKAIGIDAAIEVAMMLWQSKVRKDIISDQNDLADRQQKLADEVREHQEEFWPYEDEYLTEWFSTTENDPDHTAMPSQWNKIAKKSLTQGREDWLNEMHRRCLSPTRCEDSRWRREDRRNRADIGSFAHRHSEARADALNDSRFSKQYTALGLSKGLMNEILGYEAAMGQARMQADEMMAASVNSIASAVGYATDSVSQHMTGTSNWGLGQRHAMSVERKD